MCISTPRCCARGAVRTIWCRSNGNRASVAWICGVYVTHIVTRCCRLVSVLIWGASILSLLGCTSNIYFFVVVGPYSKYVSSTTRRFVFGARHIGKYIINARSILFTRSYNTSNALFFIYVFFKPWTAIVLFARTFDNTRHVTSV